MRGLTHKIVVNALVALFVTGATMPGLAMHYCRHSGTRSTELCECCRAILEKGRSCCAEETDSSTPVHSASAAESSCCFVSYEGPFSFEGQGSAGYTLPDAGRYVHGNLSFGVATSSIAPELEFRAEVPNNLERHTSGPPLFILTHSFRC